MEPTLDQSLRGPVDWGTLLVWGWVIGMLIFPQGCTSNSIPRGTTYLARQDLYVEMQARWEAEATLPPWGGACDPGTLEGNLHRTQILEVSDREEFLRLSAGWWDEPGHCAANPDKGEGAAGCAAGVARDDSR